MTNFENLGFQELSYEEQVETNGGFVCGGLCIGGIVAGVLFVGGVAVGAYNKYQELEREAAKEN